VPELDRDTAREWIERWDRQQEEGLADREDRFTALIDAVEEATGRPDPLILDIGCGPGSLGVRLLARLPRATVVGIDADPVSLTLGRAAYSDVPGLRFADLDLRLSGWVARLGLGTRAPDAAVSTTALHWLYEPELRALYAELASVLRPGGLLLDGDHFALDARNPRSWPPGPGAACARTSGIPAGARGWHDRWDAATARSGGCRVANRAVEQVTTSQVTLLATRRGIEGGGFAEVGTLWQRGDNRVLCAVMPGETA
jgi:SAM-dependent methyltransferase